ncbi:LutC/YkgG family protein [Pseudopelagicola sp. nBUS_20]|uniref:LutC/YkgG family protein n=1 Tax=Pseudopelagicola sp. nBUS_20 TaxID=3395317 RepID=UPI003EC0E78F
MTDSREAIFREIRTANGPQNSVDQIVTAAHTLLKDAPKRRPDFTGISNLNRFIEKATSERVTATVTQVQAFANIPEAVAEYLFTNSAGGSIALQPRKTLKELKWGEIEIHYSPSPDEPVAVSIADLAVAETGSVVFLSGKDAPTLLNFLPLHHIVVVPKHLIYRNLEDIFETVGSELEKQPRNLTIVTGTSGTADIEAKNIRGAHGPRYMHLVIVG